MSSNFEQVLEFNLNFGVLQSDKLVPKENIYDEESHTVEHCMKLIREEAKETIVAMETSDFIETVDGLIDLLYVNFGAFSRLGINADEVGGFNKQKNFLKLTPKHDIFKDKDVIKMCMEAIKSGLNQLENAVKIKNFHATIGCLMNQAYAIYGLLVIFGVNVNETFCVVHENNMSKLCKTEDEAKRSVQSYLDKKIPEYDTPAYRLAPDQKHWVVYNQSTKKVLKSIEWKPVDLKPVLGL